MVWNTLNEPEGVTNVAGQRVPEAAVICLVKRTQGQRPADARLHTGGTLVIQYVSRLWNGDVVGEMCVGRTERSGVKDCV